MIAAYETAELLKEDFGIKTKLSLNEKFVYSESSFAGAFEIARVETIDNFDDRIDTLIEVYKKIFQ